MSHTTCDVAVCGVSCFGGIAAEGMVGNIGTGSVSAGVLTGPWLATATFEM